MNNRYTELELLLMNRAQQQAEYITELKYDLGLRDGSIDKYGCTTLTLKVHPKELAYLDRHIGSTGISRHTAVLNILYLYRQHIEGI